MGHIFVDGIPRQVKHSYFYPSIVLTRKFHIVHNPVDCRYARATISTRYQEKRY